MLSDNGFFGRYGGQFVPETLIPALDGLERAYRDFAADAGSVHDLERYLKEFAGRPTPVYYAANISAKYGFDLFL